MPLSRCVFLLVLASVQTVLAQSSFRLGVYPAKTSFLTGEPIEVGLSITNTSSTPVKTNLRHSLDVKLLDQDGNQLPRTVYVGDTYGPRDSVFVSGQEWYSIISIEKYWGKPITWVPGFYTLPIGTYRFEITFKPSDQIPVQKVIVPLSIVPPTGDEALVYDTLRAIFVGLPKGKFHSESDAIRQLEALERNYTGTVYGPIILAYMHAYYRVHMKDSVRADLVMHRFLEQYPGSSKSLGFVTYQVKMMKSKSERQTFLKKLQARVKTTPMERAIQSLVRKED